MTYCFTNKSGKKTIERQFEAGKVPLKVKVGGVLYWRDFCAEHAGQRTGDPWTDHWSTAMGARTPRHAKEIARRCRAAGVECKFQFDTHGPLEVKNRAHQKRLMAVAHADRGKMANFDDC